MKLSFNPIQINRDLNQCAKRKGKRIMAKNSGKSSGKTKEAVTKGKGPKVEFPKPKKTVPVDNTPDVYYHAEGSFSVTEEGAGCSWNEASAQLCLDAAQDFLSEYAPAARPALIEFAKTATLAENWKQLNDEEYRYFGGVITKGSHMKRQRFWKYIGYIDNGRIPSFLRLRTVIEEGFNGKARAEAIDFLTKEIKARAAEIGGNQESVMRVSCVVSFWKPEFDWVINFEVAPHNYDPATMKGYKPLKDWVVRP